MSEICPVIRVLHPDKAFPFLEINESDFDPAVHKRYDAPPAVLPPPPPPLSPPPVDPLAALPKDWQTGDPAELKRLAAAVSGRAVENKAQAVQVINAALAGRGK